MVDTRVLESKYYEDDDLSGFGDVPVVLPNPTRAERREIKFLKSIYKGIMFVTGGARQGKDLFGVVLAFLMKRYFGRRILLDFKPRRLFGDYTYFNPRLMMSEISKMARLSGVDEKEMDAPLSEKQAQMFTEAANEWIDDNILMFKNAVVYLSELRRYCYKRNPSNRINKFIGALNTQWGHLDMLVVGTHMQADEIDRYTYLEKAKLWVECKWMWTRDSTTRAKVVRDMYLGGDEVVYAAMNTVHYLVDGGVPREYLTLPDTVFAVSPLGVRMANGNVILAYLKQEGAKPAGTIASALNAGIDETLEALFTLSNLGYVIGNRFFDLYFSKNLVNLVPSLSKET